MKEKIYDIYEATKGIGLDLNTSELVQARNLLSDGLRLVGLGENMTAWAAEVSAFFDR